MSVAIRAYRQYTGQAFYDHMGQFLHEIGDENHDRAIKKIDGAAKTMDGKWAFAVRKKMTQQGPGAPHVWDTYLVFVDAKMRRLRVGEKLPDAPSQRRTWITAKSVMSLVTERNPVKEVPAPSVRVGTDQTITLRRQSFDNMQAFEKFCNSLPIKKRVFVYTPTDEKAPEGDGLVIYIAVEP